VEKEGEIVLIKFQKSNGTALAKLRAKICITYKLNFPKKSQKLHEGVITILFGLKIKIFMWNHFHRRKLRLGALREPITA